VVWRREVAMASWQDFRQCPSCGLDLITGEGERACSWGECPYLPEELNVYCESCRFNFFTMEGNSPCADPLACEHATEPLAHAANVRRWTGRAAAPAR
jgi:hypothetical protein